MNVERRGLESQTNVGGFDGRAPCSPSLRGDAKNRSSSGSVARTHRRWPLSDRVAARRGRDRSGLRRRAVDGCDQAPARAEDAPPPAREQPGGGVAIPPRVRGGERRGASERRSHLRFGEAEYGVLFIAMELVPGRSRAIDPGARPKAGGAALDVATGNGPARGHAVIFGEREGARVLTVFGGRN